MKVSESILSYVKEMFYPAFIRSMAGGVALKAYSVASMVGLGYLIVYWINLKILLKHKLE